MTELNGIAGVAAWLREIEAIHAANVIYWSNKKGRTSAAVAEYELRKERLELIRWELAKLRSARVTEPSRDPSLGYDDLDNIKH